MTFSDRRYPYRSSLSKLSNTECSYLIPHPAQFNSHETWVRASVRACVCIYTHRIIRIPSSSFHHQHHHGMCVGSVFLLECFIKMSQAMFLPDGCWNGRGFGEDVPSSCYCLCWPFVRRRRLDHQFRRRRQGSREDTASWISMLLGMARQMMRR